MANSGDAIQGIITSLDQVDEQLDGLIDFINKTSPFLQDVANSAGSNAQEKINEVMDEISQNVSDKLQPIRNKIVDAISSQVQVVKQKVEEYIAPISSFVTIDWSSGTITPTIQPDLDALKSFAEGIIKMWVPTPAVEFAINVPTEIYPKVQSISGKIQQIASYQLEIPELPNITIPPLDIDVDPITLADIMGE